MPPTILARLPYAAAGFGGPMMSAWADDFDRVRPFFRRDPRFDADIRSVLDAVDAHAYPHAELALVLHAECARHGAPEAARANAAKLAEPQTYAVITGQQAGLFGGPLFTVLKALSAIRWARELEDRFGSSRRFVPVFWVASDDHDLGEVDHAYFLGASGDVERLRVELPAAQRGHAAGEVRVAEQIEGLHEALTRLVPGAAEGLIDPYRTRSLGGACAHLLSAWLGALGLVVAESTALRPLGRALFARACTEFETSHRLVRAAGASLAAAGFEPGFAPESMGEPAPFLFEHRQGKRVKLTAEDARSPDVHARLEAHPEHFSAAAALRPVLQQALFPVAAAVLGPGEMAYWAQLPDLHAHFGAVWPLLVPRASATILDAVATKSLRRLEIPAADALLPWAELQAKHVTGGPLGARLDERSKRMLAELEGIHADVRGVDRGLEPLFEKARQRIASELERVAAKVKANLAERDGARLTRLKYLSACAKPLGRPQERTLCAAQFTGFDPSLAGELLEALEPLSFEHLLMGRE
ncbi:MAG: bacillithiol biosynthesis cysteine-adding enzyme BshC [Planctomycetes bacterium]|nr:bacillithiol biosynthesis cysteine-adding enzyme BshC [Planctomycetota bacterium]